jgi:hypothetical protein
MNELSTIILGIAGVVLSLIFSYIPAVKTWYDAQANKGALMLGFNVIIAAVYFGLSCTPYAAQLNIGVSCDQPGLLILLQALSVIATANQVAYKFSNNSPAIK